MKKFKTGITALDSQLDGGFPAGSLVLLLEEPGAGADVFSFHFALEGIRNNERVIYITTDDTKEHLIQNIKVYFELEEEFNKIDIIDLMSPKIIKEDIRSVLRKIKHDPLRFIRLRIMDDDFDRAIISSLNTLVFDYDYKEIIDVLRDISMNVKRTGSVVLTMMSKGIANRNFENIIKTIADCVIELDIHETENEIQRRLKVVKLKRGLVPKAMLRYDLTDRGIKMEALMRVI